MGLKALAAILGIALVCVGILYFRERDAHAAVLSQLADKSGKEAEAAKVACSNKAAQVFHSFGYSDEGEPKNGLLPSYTNHYNPELKRCLMMLDLTGTNNGSQSHQIFDADERTPFGDYYWLPSSTKKYWEQPPVQCHMTPPGKDEAYCRSTDEWDAYAKSLMN